MNILVLGGGGREHAIVTALAGSPLVGGIFVAPGNGGEAPGARNVAPDVLDPLDARAVVAFAQAHDVGLVVIGPEAPLVAGVADVVRAAGILCFGPGASGARMEGSKRFSKEFMARHGIPTAAFGAFTDAAAALAFLKKQGAPVVVKADGLAAGKGVTVAATLEEAEQAVRECFAGRFGEAGATVVIEECMTGPECSLLVFTDGTRVLPMAPAQDHKRAGEGDTGPNTGGMGVYSPVPIVTDEEYAQMLAYMERTVAGLAAEGIDYRGVLYGGFMLTPAGPKVLEFNARFGDPETQVLLPRLKSDLLEVMLAVARGDLSDTALEWDDGWAVSVVLASAGYPGDYEKGKPIVGIEAAEALPGVRVYHAGTKRIGKRQLNHCTPSSGRFAPAPPGQTPPLPQVVAPSAQTDLGRIDSESDEQAFIGASLADGTLVTGGGRVLNVTALGADFAQARERAYAACELISFEGAWYRRDIGARALR